MISLALRRYSKVPPTSRPCGQRTRSIGTRCHRASGDPMWGGRARCRTERDATEVAFRPGAGTGMRQLGGNAGREQRALRATSALEKTLCRRNDPYRGMLAPAQITVLVRRCMAVQRGNTSRPSAPTVSP